MRIQIFVFLVIITSDLNLSHATNSQYLQSPLKPDRSSIDDVAESADAQLDTVAILQLFTDFAQRKT